MDVADLPVAVITMDVNRIITDANPAALELLGFDSLVGMPADDLRPREGSGANVPISKWKDVVSKGTTNGFDERAMVVRRADGTELDVLIDGGFHRDDDGELVSCTFIVRPKYQGPRQPGSGVKIVSAVSHELRSPLTSIRGYIALLLKRWDDIGDDDRHAMLTAVDRDARRVSRLINELLDISRIESGRVQLNRVQLDLTALAATVVETVTMAYPDLEAHLDFPADLPTAWADADKVTQVFTNLLENACKYASPKGIVIRGSSDDDSVQVQVVDQGPGIPADDLPHLFQQFFHSKTGRPTGTGLGLWISRGLIEAHKGTLTAQSDGEHGTTFTFALPLRGFEDLHGSDDF